MALDIETILESIPNAACGLDERQVAAFLRMMHVGLRSVRLSYELGTSVGNETIDVLIKAIGCAIDEYELELSDSSQNLRSQEQ